MDYSSSKLRKNPSRETCEQTIKRILMTEVLENGKNKHFKTAADFMNYFESLYLPSDALTKQVQRAVKAMDMPKDENGYFIPNKTSQQLALEKDMQALFARANAAPVRMDEYVPFFLQVEPDMITYLMHVITESPLFQDLFLTLQACSNGIIFYTKNCSQLETLINSLIVR
jgi:hypothetical protein